MRTTGLKYKLVEDLLFMKLPSEIFGQNKCRDAIICKLYSEDYSPEEIKEIRKLPITVRRIEQIVYKNRNFVKIDKDWEETKQIHRINRKIKKAPESKKDVYDWETLLDSKITTKKPIIDQSSHLHITNNINLEEFRKLPVQDKIRDILNRK